ncbi:PepSY domain-containing protein [Streptomyces silvensis]|uniref:Peptidase propeptide and YpeB domain protein n=1 Tax=Streptomyces silvensis TaxID=1765722 RepID=A0A0W7WZQ8_9ACTN|nr:PepSY domain-containing protein [Streptomyces silvensis]KUF16057.1 peptidase propeptide and YpeB domain protein [Streptomyces silvensis]
MKRNIVIATITAAALVGGGTATAFALGGDDEPSAAGRSSVQLKDHDDRDDDRDDARDDDRDDARDDARDDQDDKAEDAAEAKGAKVSAAEAIAAALKSAPGTAVSADLDEDDGALVWDVDVLGKDGRTWHSVEVDPGTGKVLGSHVERDDDGADGDDGADSDDSDDAAEDARVAAAVKGSSVTAGEAAKAAGGKGTVTSVDIDDDGSRVDVWDVETVSADGTEGHWNVDLGSGKVTADRSDD